MIDLFEDTHRSDTSSGDALDVLSQGAAHALLLDLPPDGKHILWKVICTTGQYVWHFFDQEMKRRRFKGVSESLLRQAFGSEPIDSGWLSPQVCRWGTRPDGDWVVSFRPSQCYDLQITGLGEHVPEQVRVRLPGLIFCGIGQAYYVWATKSRMFSPTAPIFLAPLPNVYGDGRICFGENTPPVITAHAGAAIEEAWRLFITSPFNADLSNSKSRAQPDDVRAQLLQSSQHKRHSYPLSDLLAYRTRSQAPVAANMAVEASLIRSTYQQREHTTARTEHEGVV
jgi:Prokaryotic E2 family D